MARGWGFANHLVWWTSWGLVMHSVASFWMSETNHGGTCSLTGVISEQHQRSMTWSSCCWGLFVSWIFSHPLSSRSSRNLGSCADFEITSLRVRVSTSYIANVLVTPLFGQFVSDVILRLFCVNPAKCSPVGAGYTFSRLWWLDARLRNCGYHILPLILITVTLKSRTFDSEINGFALISKTLDVFLFEISISWWYCSELEQSCGSRLIRDDFANENVACYIIFLSCFLLIRSWVEIG